MLFCLKHDQVLYPVVRVPIFCFITKPDKAIGQNRKRMMGMVFFVLRLI